MSRTPSKSQSLAMRAAAAIAAQDDEDEADRGEPAAELAMMHEPEASPVEVKPVPPGAPLAEPPTASGSASSRGRGRPKGKRAVEARHTVYLDAPRHSALSRLAEDRGRSVHSLILEGIDHVIGKPQNPGWQGH